MALFKGFMMVIQFNNNIVDKMSGFIAGHPAMTARFVELLLFVSIFMVYIYNYTLGVKVEIRQGVLPPVMKPIEELIPPATKPTKVFGFSLLIAILMIIGLLSN